MSKNVIFLVYLFAVVLLAFVPSKTSQVNRPTRVESLSPRIKKLVERSEANKAIDTGLLNDDPFLLSDMRSILNTLRANPNFKSYHLLIGLRRYHRNEYEELSAELKARVLCSALCTLDRMNDWGYLSPVGSFDGESADALLAIGPPALRFLVPILDNDESAPIYGSKEHTMFVKYGYRRSDFAYRYISLLLGQDAPFDREHDTRDKRIRAMKTKLHMK